MKLTIGSTDYELEEVGNSFDASNNTPFIKFDNKYYIGRAIANDPKLDYEILQVNEYKTNLWSTITQIFDSLLKNGWVIEKVKRLSDNEVFTIGDRTTKGIIHSFEKHDFWLGVNVGDQNTLLRTFDKIKPKFLFTTEDNVPIYEHDNYYPVNTDFRQSGVCNGISWYNPKNGEKYFSTKEKANEYILMNKPCLSINDLLKNGFIYKSLDGTMNKIKELAKQKINQ